MTKGHGRILIAGRTVSRIAHLLPLGHALAEARGCPLHVAGLVSVPAGKSLSTAALAARRLREKLESKIQERQGQCSVAVAHDVWTELGEVVGAEAPTLALLDWRNDIPAERLHALPGDVALLKGRMPGRMKRILLPIRGGPYAELALELALALTAKYGAEITVLHAAPAGRLGDFLHQEFLRHLRELPAVTRWINVRGDPVKAIAHEAAIHQLMVMGAAARPRPGDPPVGPTVMRVMAEASIPMLIAKSRREFPLLDLPQALKPPLDYTISVVVDKWFAENSFHAGEYSDLKHLVDLKERQGLTISLGMPALNEETTVGKVIRTLQRALVRRVPLLDEIVLIDSLSTDRTVEIAERLGVTVYRHPEILPEHGSYQGKGEALWKSLAVLKGDLIAWIDTDIENIHPRFVYGILGPLIREPRLMYVKGYYRRPLKMGRKVVDAGGGRVTELVGRPLLNLFYPELSGIAQPLSGEYAGRRSALEQVPFFTGYGVEVGLLIDILSRFGLSAIGQVDLEQRIHHGQPLGALTRMAFAIIQVVMQRVGDQKNMALIDAMNQSLKMIRYGEEQFELEVEDIRDAERPPMAHVLQKGA